MSPAYRYIWVKAGVDYPLCVYHELVKRKIKCVEPGTRFVNNSAKDFVRLHLATAWPGASQNDEGLSGVTDRKSS